MTAHPLDSLTAGEISETSAIIAREKGIDAGWRYASIAMAALALLLVPFVLWLLRERPHDLGLKPYGAPADWVEPEPLDDRGIGPARVAILRLREASRSRAFWLLMAGFFVCGWSTNGLVGTHFISAAHDHGLPITTGATLLAFIGIFDVIGTIGSGWLTDRYDPRILLAVYYGLRGVSLLLVHLLWAPTVQPPMFFFVVLYGLDWVATVPPTVALCRDRFGIERAEYPFAKAPGRIHELRDALAQTMWDDVGVLRRREAMEHGLQAVAGHRAALRDIGVADGDRRYNVTWHDWLNLESLVDISKVITVSALARENSRGAHFREDFPEPGDLHTSCYTRVSAQDGEVRLEMVPVSFDIVKPGESLIEGEAGIPQTT